MGADPKLAPHAVVLMTAAGKTLPLVVAQGMGSLGVTLLSKPFDIYLLTETGLRLPSG
jgi:hypothetical protein